MSVGERRPALTIDRLPLFADDEQIGEAVLGRERACEFKRFATLLEPRGMPKISPFWGGRYVPAVKAFLDTTQGIASVAPLKEDGMEGSWQMKDRKVPA
jgi:hypothetical protein